MNPADSLLDLLPPGADARFVAPPLPISAAPATESSGTESIGTEKKQPRLEIDDLLPPGAELPPGAGANLPGSPPMSVGGSATGEKSPSLADSLLPPSALGAAKTAPVRLPTAGDAKSTAEPGDPDAPQFNLNIEVAGPTVEDLSEILDEEEFLRIHRERRKRRRRQKNLLLISMGVLGLLVFGLMVKTIYQRRQERLDRQKQRQEMQGSLNPTAEKPVE